MADDFPEMVEAIVGPVLAESGFVLDVVDDHVDEGGRFGSVVYYCAADCRVQIYWSSRAGEINCMVAPLDAQNDHGLYDRAGKWHYLREFAEKPSLALEELVKRLKAEKANFETLEKWLTWLRGQIEEHLPAARGHRAARVN